MEIKTPYGLILKKNSGSLEGVKILEETLEVFMPEEYQDQVQIMMPIYGIIFLVVGKLIMKKTSALDAQILTANGLSGQLAAKRVDQGNRKDLFKFLQNKEVSNAQAQELKIATWKIAHVRHTSFRIFNLEMRGSLDYIYWLFGFWYEVSKVSCHVCLFLSSTPTCQSSGVFKN